MLPPRQALPPPLDLEGLGVHDEDDVGLAETDQQVSGIEIFIVPYK